jgi:hypothetical protein
MPVLATRRHEVELDLVQVSGIEGGSFFLERRIVGGGFFPRGVLSTKCYDAVNKRRM